MRGHTCALFGAKYPNQVKGIILCAAMLKDKIHIFLDITLPCSTAFSIV